MAYLTLEYSNAIGNEHFEAAKQIIADRAIDRLIGVQLVNNKLVFKIVKNLNGLNENILKLCDLSDYTDNNFIAYENVNFGHKKFDYVTHQVTTKFNNTIVLLTLFKDGSVKICDSSGD